MFSAERMRRLQAVVLEQDERKVLRGLGELGALHILRTQAGPETAPIAPPDRGLARARCDRLDGRLAELRRLLELPAAPPRAAAPTGAGDFSLENLEADLAAVETQARALAARRDQAQQQWGQVAALVEQMAAYGDVDIPFTQIGQASFYHFALGRLSGDRLETLRNKAGPNVVLMPLPGSDDARPALLAASSRKGRFALDAALEEVGFERENLAVPEGRTPARVAEEGRKEQTRLDSELKALRAAVAELARTVESKWAVWTGALESERRLIEAEESFPRTAATVLMTGWVPVSRMPAVEERLRAVTGGRCAIETSSPDDVPDGEIPILLRHSRLLRPFEMLTSGYGLPGYRDLEPTLFVAITYVLMFGMMFGDVGHGGILALGGLAAWRTGRTRKVRDLGVLVLLAGLSSIAFGFVYGSCFGLESFRHLALWHDPLEGNPMSLMLVAVGVGVAIISLGMVLNMINRFRKRDIAGGFLDRFGVVGALFYWGVLAVILKYAALQERGLTGMALLLVVALPIAIWVLKEPVAHVLRRRAGGPAHGGSLFESAMESAVETFEAVLGYMANTISFVRLAAYAMSHAAILMATFVMAEELRQVAGGGVWSVLIIIIGNAVAILLEGIIASVQALRLEYYEFFGKFFAGSGMAFKPFRLGLGREESEEAIGEGR